MGQGRAGKTTLLHNLLGLPIADIRSTVGIEAFEYSILHASTAGGDRAEQSLWQEAAQDHLAEQAYAAAAAAANRNQAEANKTNARATAAAAAAAAAHDDSVTTSSGGGARSNPSKASKAKDSQAAAGSALVPTAAAVAPANFEAAPVADIDADVVMKYLGDYQSTQGIRFSVFDYGGQAVFYPLHQLFLTANSIYIIVFALTDLLRGSAAAQAEAREHVAHWIESVVVHTLNAETQNTAAVFFVGTHRDQVSSPEDHDATSRIVHELIDERGSGRLRIVPNLKGVGQRGVTSHQMFVIDNTAGASDSVLVDLRAAIETTARAEAYVTQLKPASWLKFADLVRAEVPKGSSYMGLQEAAAVALSVGIPQRDVEPLLLFLHQSGLLVWFAEPALRDVVILDPIDFFVVPATLIIRRHRPTDDDATWHTTVNICFFIIFCLK